MQKKIIFRDHFQSCHCSESIFSVDRSFEAVDDIFSESDINKIGNVFKNKGIKEVKVSKRKKVQNFRFGTFVFFMLKNSENQKLTSIFNF